jgi:hypothetical protein
MIGLLTLTAIPTTIGVAEGVSHQKQENAAKADENRMSEFHLNAYCENRSSRAKDVHGKRIVLRDGKVITKIEEERGGRTGSKLQADRFYLSLSLRDDRSTSPHRRTNLPTLSARSILPILTRNANPPPWDSYRVSRMTRPC